MRKKEYDFTPRTVGEHVNKKRLQLGLTQKQVAKQLGVSEFSVLNWETNANQPDDAPILQRIIHFLGYDPVPVGATVPHLLRAKRRALGIGQRELAAHLGVDPSTITNWERGGRISRHRDRRILARFLGVADKFLRD